MPYIYRGKPLYLTSGLTPHDAESFVDWYGKRESNDWGEPDKIKFKPRPKFGPPANPLIAAFRHDVATVNDPDREEDYYADDRNIRGVARRWVWYIEEGEQAVCWDEDCVQQALRVFCRLAGIDADVVV